MDAKKNTNKEAMPKNTEEMPAAPIEEKDALDDMQMVPITSVQPKSSEMPVIEENPAEELNDYIEPVNYIQHMSNDEEMTETPYMDLSEPPMMRSYFEDNSSYDYDYNSFDYREFNHFEQHGHFDGHNDYDEVDEILRKIERYNPGVIRRMVSYGIPYPVALNLVRRIIRLTLNYK